MNRDLFAAGTAATSGGVPDPLFKSTVLLLSGDGTNGAQNNTIVDSSGNNLALTRGGALSQGSVSPFSKTGWSLYSPTWGLMYTYNDTNYDVISTNDFTVEFWLNHVNPSVDVLMAASTGSNWQVTIRSNQLNWVQDGVNLTASGTLPINQWNHYAVSRVGGFLSIYVNGTRQYYAANDFDYSYSTGTRYIGAITGSSGNVAMSNLRIIIGEGLYSGATITVPTSPLTSVVGTVLLTCQSNRMLDKGPIGIPFQLANATNPSIQPISPFAPSSAYNSATEGGSLYFNPVNTDFLTTPANTALTLGTGNFTLEFWIYRNTTASTTVLFDSSTIGYLGFSITATQLMAEHGLR